MKIERKPQQNVGRIPSIPSKFPKSFPRCIPKLFSYHFSIIIFLSNISPLHRHGFSFLPNPSSHLNLPLSLISPIKLLSPFHTHHLTTQITPQNPSPHPLLHLLQSCSNLQTLKQIHSLLILTTPSNPFPNFLIQLYSHFRDLKSSFSVFKTLPQPPNTLSWNLIMKARVDHSQFHSCIDLFRQMREADVKMDSFTLPIVNRAVSLLGDQLRFDEMVHCVGIRFGFGEDLYFGNTLIEMYVKNGVVGNGYKVFDEMPSRDLVSWTSMISGYVLSGEVSKSYKLFNKMRMDSFEPNLVTLLIMFGACSVDKNVDNGKTLHGCVIKKGLKGNVPLENSVLTMYCKSGSFQDCEILFRSMLRRDTVSWNIMISAYSLQGDSSRVADMFDTMRTEMIPSLETLTLVISSFAKSRYLQKGKKVHGYVLKTGVFDVVLNTSLVDFYAKCEDVESSFQLFQEVPCRNHITWSAMMSGLVQNGRFKEAIELFCKMQLADLKPGIDILRNLVHSYTHLGALQLGKVVHGIMIRNMFHSLKENNVVMQTSIMNMYAKCGSIVSARRCFSQIANKDVVAWSSLIEGYSSHGLAFEALELFNQMMDEGVEPNSITFLSLLSACSHSGLMKEGFDIFDLMSKRFGIEPDINHYTCLVDLLGRSGKLQEAREVIEKMATKADSRIWGSLLAACSIHFDNKLGAYAAERVLEFDNPDYNTLLSNVHASSQRWAEADSVRGQIQRKPPGWSCIEITGRLHGFVAMDVSHPQVGEIYALLGRLNRIAVDDYHVNF